MKEIKLTQGYVALVDDEDYERVMQYRWHVQARKRTKYAWRSVCKPDGRWTSLMLHRFILNLPSGMVPQVDHKDRNGLNCQKENLRIATGSENNANQRKRPNLSSRYKGVAWYKQTNKWMAHFTVNRKKHHLGYYFLEEEAARAYDAAMIKTFGEFALTNFPSTSGSIGTAADL